MRFDAYAGNVWGGPKTSEVADAVARSAHSRIERGRPRGRYSDVWDVKDAADSIGWVGFDAQLDTAYFEFKGVRTPDTAGAIRKFWPGKHTVSRLDSCEDYDAPGAYRQLVALLDRSKDPRVQSKSITPRDGDRGETIYWGSPQSRVMVRCYEKGKMRENIHLDRPSWARVEAQIRPGKAAEKALAALITPLDAWGHAAWSKRAAEALSQVEVPRYTMSSTPATYESWMLYSARQFRRRWEEALENLGDWECIGREYRSIWEADDAAAALRAGSRTES